MFVIFFIANLNLHRAAACLFSPVMMDINRSKNSVKSEKGVKSFKLAIKKITNIFFKL